MRFLKSNIAEPKTPALPMECGHAWSKWEDRQSRETVKSETTSHYGGMTKQTDTETIERGSNLQERRCSKCNRLDIIQVIVRKV